MKIKIPEGGWDIELNYFKGNGTWYSQGVDYINNDKITSMHEIKEVVLGWKKKRILPDLVPGHDDFIVLIDVPNHPHNHLMLLNDINDTYNYEEEE